MASPSKKPPRNRKITGFAKDEAVLSSGAMFNNGNITNGSNATTGIGKDSVTHKEIISIAAAITLLPAASTPNGFKK